MFLVEKQQNHNLHNFYDILHYALLQNMVDHLLHLEKILYNKIRLLGYFCVFLVYSPCEVAPRFDYVIM